MQVSWTCARGHMHHELWPDNLSPEDQAQFHSAGCQKCREQDAQHSSLAKQIAKEVVDLLAERGFIKPPER